MDLKDRQIESFVFKYDRSKKIKDLILASNDNIHLLSVKKKYSNNEYFGAYNFFLVLDEKPFVFKHFKCKDRGFTEELVDNKDAYIEYLFEHHFRSGFKSKNFDAPIRQDIKLDKINGRDFYIEYGFKDGFYFYTDFIFDNPPAVFRGLYGSENLEKDTKLYGIAIPKDSTPTFEDLLYLRDQAEISFSNVYHEVSTEYSQIEVLNNGT